MKLSFVFLGLVICVGACSSKEEAPDPYATVGQFCLAWGQNACTPEAVLACAGDSTAASTQKCVSSQETLCEHLVPTTGYSSTQALTCLNAVRTAYSDGKLSAMEIAIVRHRGDPCNHLIKGPQGVGETCNTDDDCDTLQNYQCVVKPDKSTCQIPKAVAGGKSCTGDDVICEDGNYCNGRNCVAFTDLGDSCTGDVECGPGYVCDPDQAVCTAKVSANKCTSDSDCTSDAACDLPAGKCLKNIQLSPSEMLCQDLQ